MRISKKNLKFFFGIAIILVVGIFIMRYLQNSIVAFTNSPEYYYDGKKSTPLCEIMGRNGSDKGNKELTRHNYTPFYYSIFKDIKDNNLRIFELGLGTNNTSFDSNMGPDGIPGASLYGWSEFFPNSMIFGADIDKGILFQEKNIKTFYCDQTKPEIIKSMWDEPVLSDNFDIIIDDGLHTFAANVTFFENSIHKLNAGGYYIIEDILNDNVSLFKEKIKEWETKYTNYSFKILPIPDSDNKIDNTLIVIYKYK